MKANPLSTTMIPKGKTKDYLLDDEEFGIIQSAYPRVTNDTTGRGTVDSGNSLDFPSPAGTKPSSSSFSIASPNGTQSSTPGIHGVHSESRGITHWEELSDHTATWDHRVALIVRMDVDRETLDLHTSELKLTVLQVSCPQSFWMMRKLTIFAENRPR